MYIRGSWFHVPSPLTSSSARRKSLREPIILLTVRECISAYFFNNKPFTSILGKIVTSKKLFLGREHGLLRLLLVSLQWQGGNESQLS